MRVFKLSTILLLVQICCYGCSAQIARSPLTGNPNFPEREQELIKARKSISAPSGILPSLVPGGLYGTDGANLYLINKNTGVANLIGPHGPVEFAIGALVFDTNDVLYGISLTSAAQLYKINVNTGTATAVGPLGIGFVFEGGLAFDPSGRLLGVDQGNDGNAKTFKINTTTGAATIVGPNPGDQRDINGMALDGSVLYAIECRGNSLGTVDITTGAYTTIGSPNSTIGVTGGLAIDPADGKFYASFSNTGGFYTLDKNTGTESFIATNNVDYGLAFAKLPQPEPELYSYSVKFVCGVQERDDLDGGVVRQGRYATDINIHNYNNTTVSIRKYILPVVREGKPIGREPKLVEITAQDGILLPPNTATMDDCFRIAELLYGSPPPDPMPFTIGFMEFVSNGELNIDAVYTTTDLNGQSLSIEVERIKYKIK